MGCSARHAPQHSDCGGKRDQPEANGTVGPAVAVRDEGRVAKAGGVERIADGHGPAHQ